MVLVYYIIGLALIVGATLGPLSMFSLGLDNSVMNRRIKDAEGPAPDEVRGTVLITSQLVPISMANLLAAALAGIGSSLLVDGGRLRWPASQAPLALIAMALAITLFSGMAIVAYVTRPIGAWVTDSAVFRSWLRRIIAQGPVSEAELMEIQRQREQWKRKTHVRPLRKPNELHELRLELWAADKEWDSESENQSVKIGASLRKEVTAMQAWRWLMCRRKLRLGVPAFISGVSAAGITAALIRWAGVSAHSSRLLFVVLALLFTGTYCLIAFRIAILDLVMTNRYLALERAQLRDCDHLIGQIKKQYMRAQEGGYPNSVGGTVGVLLVRIGHWDLRHHATRAKLILQEIVAWLATLLVNDPNYPIIAGFIDMGGTNVGYPEIIDTSPAVRRYLRS